MTEQERREAARQFWYKWNGKGKEDEDARSYWIDILQGILGMDRVTDRVDFEKKVIGGDGNTKRIDVYIPETRVLIEQKSLGIALDKPQAGHNGQTPYEQAKYYDNYLPYEEKARWIVTSNFAEIWIYDMNARVPEPEIIKIENLQTELYRLQFLIQEKNVTVTREIEISKDAGRLVGKIYDAFLKQYKDPENDESLRSLNALCVRLVFCLYAEDADIFGGHNMFRDYLMRFEARDLRRALIDLFHVLDQKPEERDAYLDPELAAFPYVNGGLFSDENIEIPHVTNEIKTLLLTEACEFNWAEISPTIFGAVFESTLNPETRRAGGMHYTSIENIHKVIDPLFLDDLKAELEEIREITVAKTQKDRLASYQNKLASLTFLDPACGSGNFLTESYLSIRRLENEVLKLQIAANKKDITGQIIFALDDASPIKVSIQQFYGIEINDFAVSVAMTALWIAESQMLKETEDVVHQRIEFLPLKSFTNIVEGNALQLNWNSVVPKEKLDFIMGNPPFSGARIMGSAQKKDVNTVFAGWKNVGNFDYVCCWYKKSADFMQGTDIRTALVSTNSVTQGETVANLWGPLFSSGVHIDFAYRTFVWDSEANEKAHVHCVIVGFSTAVNKSKRVIYTGAECKEVNNINGYLIDAENIFVESRNKPICDVPEIGIGNKPIDGGFYLFEEEEKDSFIKKEPESEKYFRQWYGSREFINRSPRYCLWLGDCSPAALRSMPECLKRVEAVKEYRLKSTSPGTVKLAERPTRFHVENMPESTYVVIPEVSSERRRYIPIGFMTPDIMCSNLVKLVPNATLYHFGVLTSNVHMAWMRAVCGRLKSDYRYSKDIVYNNFPWPDVSDENRKKIEKTAQAILDARDLYPDSSLADLYDPLTMPIELTKTHQENDRAVMQAYGFNIKEMSEADCVAELMKLYQEKISGKGV